MSKYENIQQAYVNFRYTWTQYKDNCLNFLERLAIDFANYLECVRDNIRFLPPSQVEVESRQYPLSSAMIPGKDSYWHTKLVLSIDDPDTKDLHDHAAITLSFKQTNDFFTVKINEIDEDFRIHSDNETEFQRLFEYIYEFIKRFYENSFHRFLNQSREIEDIGFTSNQIRQIEED